MTEPPAEHLIRLKLEDGTFIDFRRTEKHEVLISREGHSVNLGKATGKQTLDLVALLEPFGHLEEVNNEAT